MGQPASRTTDLHTCPMCNGPVPHVGGPILPAQVTVLIGGLPAARATDPLVCVGPPDLIDQPVSEYNLLRVAWRDHH